MFTPLHSSMNKELFEKYVCNQSSHYENTDGAVHPSYHPSLSAAFDSLNSSTNQELFEKYLYNKSSHYEKYGRFLVMQRKPSCVTT